MCAFKVKIRKISILLHTPVLLYTCKGKVFGGTLYTDVFMMNSKIKDQRAALNLFATTRVAW